MNSMEAKRVMNGKYADLYIDGDLMAEATAFKAEVTLTKEEVKMLRHVGKGYKVTGYDCKGVELHDPEDERQHQGGQADCRDHRLRPG